MLPFELLLSFLSLMNDFIQKHEDGELTYEK